MKKFLTVALVAAAAFGCQAALAQEAQPAGKSLSCQTDDQSIAITQEGSGWTYRAWSKSRPAGSAADVVMMRGTRTPSPECRYGKDYLWRGDGRMISVTIGRKCLEGAPKNAIGEIYFFNGKTGAQTGQGWLYAR